MKKRMLSLLLSIVMVLTMLPVTAFAADPMSAPLQEAWTKIAGRINGDAAHSVYAPYAIAVNDKSAGDNPDIYVTTNDYYYRVMKGTYDTASKKYIFNELGGTGKPNFDANNMPVSLSLDGSFSGDGDLYIATNKGASVPIEGKVWKFDGSSWTDLTYGQGITNPSIAANQGNLYVGGGGSAPYLCVLLKGSTKWEKLQLGSYIKSSLVAIAVSRNGDFGNVFALDSSGRVWRIIVFPNGSATELVSCTQIAAAPSGGGSGLAVLGMGGKDNWNLYVTDQSKGCVQALTYEANGSWVVMKNGLTNAFGGPNDIAVSGQRYLYVADPGADNTYGAVFMQHSVPNLVFATQPGSCISGGNLTQMPVLKLMYSDAVYPDKVAVDNSIDQVTVTLTSGTGTLHGTQTVTLNQGVATFSDLGVTGSGNFKLTAACGGLTVESGSFTVSLTQLAAPTGLAWDGTVSGKGTWSPVANAASYTAQLYKDGTPQGSPVTNITATEYDFTSAITTEGTGRYTFSVTAIGNGSTHSDSAASNISVVYDYTTPPGVLTGTATIINTTPRIGDGLVGLLQDGPVTTGTLTYTWKADGIQVQADTVKSYTVKAADLGKTITLEITDTLTTGTVTSAPTAAVAKKAAPTAPSAPTLSSKTDNSVTLTVNAAYEFSKDGAAWQTSNVFTSLAADTAYTFYQRIAETSDTEASAASVKLDVTTDAAPVNALTGTATIDNTSPRIGDTLTGSLVGGNNTGTLTYIWKAGGTQVGTNAGYTVTAADLGKTITLEITSSVETGTVTSAATAAVRKKAAPAAPMSPSFYSKTYNNVTLLPIAAYEFSKDGTTWQMSSIFSGLTASTTYPFYQRIAETSDTEASAASPKLDVTTDPAPTVTLQSIAITTQAAKLEYTVGEALDISGMVVTGTYSDSSTKTETITAANVTGFDSSTPAVGQTLTVTVGGKTTTYTVNIKAAPVIDASISPVSASYDLASPADVSTNITWNSAHTVSDVVYATASMATPADYTVSGNVLTIKESYLAAQGFTAGDTADFTISFDEGNPATLTVNIVDNYIPGSNADLSDLTVGGSTLSGFAPDTTSYHVELPYGTQAGSMAATVSATADDSKAGVLITQAASLPSSATVEVTAEDGTTKTYTVSFTLEAPPAQSSEKDVTSVTTPGGANIGSTSITAIVANSVTGQAVSLSVSAKASWKLHSDAGCTSEIADKIMTLSEGANAAYVEVTAEDGSTKVYTLTITRQSSGSSVILVTRISITGGNTITAKGGALQLAADVTPAEATNKAVTWSIVSGSSYATLNPIGLLTAQSNGTVTVRATAQDGSSAYGELQVSISGQGGNGDSGGTGGGGGNTADTKTAISTESQPDYPVTAEISVNATVDKNGHATASIPENAIADAIKKAATAAKLQGKAENGIGISVKVNVPANTKSFGLVLSQSVLRQLADAKVQQFEVNGQLLTLSLDQEAIRQLLSQSTGDVTVTVSPVTVEGIRNAYEITFTTVKDGKTVTITSLGSGSATLSIPCTPAKTEAAGYLYAVYVDAKGKHNRISGSAYDANSRSMIFSTDHFSVYGVGYEAPSARYTDIGSHWAKESIDYVVGRGLLSGTSKTTFAPDTAMTRGMLVTALGRLAGVDVKAYATNSFTDVKANSAFRPYIEWAYSKGVVQGIGNGQFAPDRAITREEIAVIFTNFAKATGYKLPVTRTATTYADASGIGSAYKDAVKALQQAGIMMGEANNKFNPKSNATRAEVSAMLHRYIKLTIDPATAQGWAKNDDGQYLYYKDGKALTGTQTIDGMKYFFNPDGTLKTGWVKDGGNWRYYSGNKAAVSWLDISDKRYYFTKDGLMVSGKWLQLDGKWYYFYADGPLARSTKIDEFEVDENGVRKTK